ncbi:hypothetical protein ACFWPV_01775 [Streptomyces uncialis]|uniref:hypothetical protein n=1 Tax=Streptomyces uncialis TaxID=1048205 RepID=UPI003669B547
MSRPVRAVGPLRLPTTVSGPQAAPQRRSRARLGDAQGAPEDIGAAPGMPTLQGPQRRPGA